MLLLLCLCQAQIDSMIKDSCLLFTSQISESPKPAKKRIRVADNLLRDEALELAQHLRRAARLTKWLLKYLYNAQIPPERVLGVTADFNIEELASTVGCLSVYG